MHPCEKLHVWQRSHLLALSVYRATERWADLSLRTQSRRAAASVPSNIVEGASSASQAMFARFVGIALASAAELEYQLRFACDLGSLPAAEHEPLRQEIIELKRMLIALHRRLRTNSPTRRAPGP